MAEVIHITSFAGRLRSELGSLAEQTDAFVAASTIVYEGHLNRGGAVFIVAPDYVWGQPSDELRRLQMGLVPRFDQTTERLDMLFRSRRPISRRPSPKHTPRSENGWRGMGQGGPGGTSPPTLRRHERCSPRGFGSCRRSWM